MPSRLSENWSPSRPQSIQGSGGEAAHAEVRAPTSTGTSASPCIVQQIAADSVVTHAESESLQNALQASGGCHLLAQKAVELYYDSGVRFHQEAHSNLAKALLDLGYAVEAAACPKQAVQDNINTPDAAFERVVGIAGEVRGKAHVAVLDGGFETSHQALAGRLRSATNSEGSSYGLDLVHGGAGLDAAHNDADRFHIMHGTHVMGIATRGGDRVEGTAVRVIHGEKARPTLVREAIEYAVAQGARVVNMSFGMHLLADFRSAVATMAEHPNVLFVVAAGNWGADVSQLHERVEGFGAGPWFLSMPPAEPTLKNLALVAATDAQGNLLEASSYGAPCVHLATRGETVVSSVPGGRYESHTGTSMAAPKIANIAAKCMLLAPSLTAAQLRLLLEEASPKRDDFTGKITAGGPIDDALAYMLAAMAKGNGEGPESAQHIANLLTDDPQLAKALVDKSQRVLAAI